MPARPDTYTPDSGPDRPGVSTPVDRPDGSRASTPDGGPAGSGTPTSTGGPTGTGEFAPNRGPARPGANPPNGGSDRTGTVTPIDSPDRSGASTPDDGPAGSGTPTPPGGSSGTGEFGPNRGPARPGAYRPKGGSDRLGGSPHGVPYRPGAVDPGPHPAEAAALAGAFAVDYLSWDEDDPARRGRVLQDYLPAPGSDPARLGWSGRGRQRGEFALPGRVRSDGDGRVLVDVRVRVTPYRSVGEHAATPATPEPEPDIAGIPAAAPAPTGRGWRSLASFWIRLSVPVVIEGGRLVVDAWEETLGDEAAEPDEPPRAAVDDHSLADDDPLVEPGPGGGW